jgi:hypothetical protein
MTIYRGYDITRNDDGTYSIHSMGSFPVVDQTFPSETAAMDFIDQARRNLAR